MLDPVLTATSGDALAQSGVERAIVERLFPLATLITPNFEEAARLGGLTRPAVAKDVHAAAERLHRLWAKALLITGGDAAGETADDFYFDGAELRVFSAPRVATRNTHGTGCTLSSAIAAFLGRGYALPDAIAAAKTYVTGALQGADELERRRRTRAAASFLRACGREGAEDHSRSSVFGSISPPKYLRRAARKIRLSSATAPNSVIDE